MFFQRPKKCGGGYWLDRTYDDLFWLDLEFLISLHDDLVYLIHFKVIGARSNKFKDDFCCSDRNVRVQDYAA